MPEAIRLDPAGPIGEPATGAAGTPPPRSGADTRIPPRPALARGRRRDCVTAPGGTDLFDQLTE